MSAMQEIKKAQVQSRKDRNEVFSSVLTTLLGEAEMIGKNAGNRESTDAEVVAVVKKFIKNIDETIAVLTKASVPDTAKIGKFNQEKVVLSAYLPKQLTEDELRQAMKDIVASNSLVGPKAMGTLMKELKAKFEGQYDGGLASKLSKEVLV
jgi:uncharacterized protein